jgi:hypothetical protein
MYVCHAHLFNIAVLFNVYVTLHSLSLFVRNFSPPRRLSAVFSSVKLIRIYQTETAMIGILKYWEKTPFFSIVL